MNSEVVVRQVIWILGGLASAVLVATVVLAMSHDLTDGLQTALVGAFGTLSGALAALLVSTHSSAS